jgi:Fem-1 family protein b
LRFSVEDDVFLLEADLKEHMNTFIYLLVIFTKVRKGGTGDERFEAMKSIYQVVRMNPRYRDGRTLLHLCVDSSTDVDTFHTADIVRFPSAAATRLLVEAGADVETMDNSRNTPLHYIVKYKRVVHDFSTLHSIIR